MRKSHVFVGTSHPELGQLICDRLGVEPGPCTLKKFSNGETSIEIGVSVRDEDVYVVQSGSSTINDHIMELLILISGCKGGSANKITAVIPSFPYAKQSKMKKHRGAITARMLANLLIMAGADHVITMDLHATQMQGFFSKPVDNLLAGPTLARWIRHNVPDYSAAVIVSKNPGGTKRVTALADALKVNFAMIHTDRRRTLVLPRTNGTINYSLNNGSKSLPKKQTTSSTPSSASASSSTTTTSKQPSSNLSKGFSASDIHGEENVPVEFGDGSADGKVKVVVEHTNGTSHVLSNNTNGDSTKSPQTIISDDDDDSEEEEVNGISTHSVHIARVVQGHVVPDNADIDAFTNGTTTPINEDDHEYGSNNLQDSVYSLASHGEHALGGTGDAESSDEDDDIASNNNYFNNAHGSSSNASSNNNNLSSNSNNTDPTSPAAVPPKEKVITLVGDVRGRTAIILDDMIDSPGSFIAAAELCYNNCGAKRVIVVATHGIFSGNSLELLEECPCIDQIVVTNTYPIPLEKRQKCKKLVVIDISTIFAECIRRNHHGESISVLFEQLLTI